MGKVEISLVLITKFLFEGFNVGLLIIKVKKKAIKLFLNHILSLKNYFYEKNLQLAKKALPIFLHFSPLKMRRYLISLLSPRSYLHVHFRYR